MPLVHKAYMNWSGGKDSSLCLYALLTDHRYKIDCLVTNVNETQNRVSMHGVRLELIQAQAAALGIALQTICLPAEPCMQEFERLTAQKTAELKKHGYDSAVFGDIFLEDLRTYRENKLAAEGVTCVFPLWKKDTALLVREFISLGFKAIVVCVNEQYLDAGFCGRLIDESFIDSLPPDVDPCGENGEYHSFVFDGPIFQYPVPFTIGETVRRTYKAPAPAPSTTPGAPVQPDYGFYFCELLP